MMAMRIGDRRQPFALRTMAGRLLVVFAGRGRVVVGVVADLD